MPTYSLDQLKDAVAFAEALSSAFQNLPDEPEWGGGMRLWMPSVIPLRPDYRDSEPVLWLVSNDFDGFDVATEDPTPKES